MSTPLYEAISRLSGDTEARLLRLYDALLAGTLTGEEFTAYAVALVGRANATAYGLADASLLAAVETSSSRASAALGLAPPASDADRLRKGVSTLLAALNADDEPDVARVARYGRSEPISAMQDAYVEGMTRRGLPGYRRVLSPGACELCHWLYRDGYVYPADKPFHRHGGCACHPEPIVSTT